MYTIKKPGFWGPGEHVYSNISILTVPGRLAILDINYDRSWMAFAKLGSWDRSITITRKG